MQEKKAASTGSWFALRGPSPFGRWNGNSRSGHKGRGRQGGHEDGSSEEVGVVSRDKPSEDKENLEPVGQDRNDGRGVLQDADSQKELKGPGMRGRQRVRRSSWQSVRSLMGL